MDSNYHNLTNDQNASCSASAMSELNRTIKARIKSKIFLSTFRLNDNAKNVELSFNAALNKVEITSTFNLRIQRKYSINFEDIPTIMQADFNFDGNEQNIKEIHCNSQTFKSTLVNFAHSLAELTLFLSEQELAIKSFIDDVDTTNSDQVFTEVHLKRSEFDEWIVNLPLSVHQITLTVVQKEFKAFLTLCQSMDEDIKIYLTDGGQPIMLTNVLPLCRQPDIQQMPESKAMTLRLIMATISDNDEMSVPQQPNQPQQTPSNLTSKSMRSLTSNSNPSVSDKSESRQQQQQQRRRKQRQRSPTNSNISYQSSHPSVASLHRSNGSNHNHNNKQNEEEKKEEEDDNDVVNGMTRGQFEENYDENERFLLNETVASTQHITVRNDAQEQSEESEVEIVDRTKKKNYQSRLQPHPDSITPPPKDKRMEVNDTLSLRMDKRQSRNDENENFMVNPPEFGNNGMENGDMNEFDLQSDDDLNMDSMQPQYTISDRNNNKYNDDDDAQSDFLLSALDRMTGHGTSMTIPQKQTQAVGQIADRLEKERSEFLWQGNNGGRKRRYEEDDIFGNASKRQRFDDSTYNNNNSRFSTNTLRRKPKSVWNPDI